MSVGTAALNVYTQAIDGAKIAAAEQIGNGLIAMAHRPERARRETTS